MFDKLDYGSGIKYKYVDFDYDNNKDLLEQLDILKEDLIQIQYNNGYIIDVGWYPEFSRNGLFKVYIFENADIVLERDCNSIIELIICIEEFVLYVHS